MKLLTNFPSVLAKVSDLVERNVTSDIEVRQSTDFPLLRMPQAFRIVLTSDITTVQTDSFAADVAGQVLALGTVAQRLVAKLQRGVWFMRFNVHYQSDFTAFASAGLEMQLLPQGRIFNVIPFTQSIHYYTEKLFTLEADSGQIQINLAAAAAAQNHRYSGTVWFERLL